jgi:hypothetical protein
VKGLSLENQRLSAQLEFVTARKQEHANALLAQFNAQFNSTEDLHHLPQVVTESKQPAAQKASVAFPALNPSHNKRATVVKKVPADGPLRGSLSIPLMPTAATAGGADAVSAANSVGSRNKPLKSIEQLLGSALDQDIPGSNSGSVVEGSKAAGEKKKKMTAEEKIAKIVELNLEEIKSNNKKR